MLLTIGLFTAAFIAAAFVAPSIYAALSVLFVPLGRSFRALRVPLMGLHSALSVFLGMLIFGAGCRAVGREPSAWMFAFAFVPMLLNDLNRVRRASIGDTRIRELLEAEGDVYEAAVIRRQELGMLIGDVLGLWVAYFIA